MLKFNGINDIENQTKNEIKRKELLTKNLQHIDDTNKFTVRIDDNTKHMDFTFGIITDGKNDEFIRQIIESIEENNIPVYEVIIVGNTKIEPTYKINVILFNETIKPGWITRKKNIIAKTAKYENIVIMHDYVALAPDWYAGFLKYGTDYDWCVNKIMNSNDTRFRDYTLFPYDVILQDKLNTCILSPGSKIDNYFYEHCLLPYDFVNTIETNKFMYISGTYYVVKKWVAQKFLLDEDLVHGKGEDIEYSRRLHNNNIIIKCNALSSVKFLKYKEPSNFENLISPEYLELYIEKCKNKS